MKNILCLILIILSFITGYYLGKNQIVLKYSKPLIIHDTTLVEKWESKIAKDTVFTFIDKIIYKEIPAKVITYQKIDTIYLKKVERLNTLLDVSKEKDSLKVFTVNINKSLAREFTFPSTLPEFRLIAKNEDVLYAEKRNILEFEGIKIGGALFYEINEVKPKYNIEVKTGVGLFRKMNVELFFNSEMRTGINFYYKF
jgi:hypothetical protein